MPKLQKMTTKNIQSNIDEIRLKEQKRAMPDRAARLQIVEPKHTAGSANTTHLGSERRSATTLAQPVTSIIIPCYNEAARLDVNSFIEFALQEKHVKLVFIDDGSKDTTIQVLTNILKAVPDRVDVLIMKKNQGKAEAVRHGLNFAAKRGDDLIAFLDADLATPLNAILDFISVAKRLPEIDVVFGSRCGGMGRRVYRKIYRKGISLICAFLGRLATGLPIRDTQCGAKLFRNNTAFRRSLSEPFKAGWLFDIELFLRISDPSLSQKKRFFEFPVIQWTEIPGSKIKVRDIFKSGLKMLNLIFNQWKIRRRFQRRTDNTQFGAVQNLVCGTYLTYPDLLRFIQKIDPEIRRVQFDLSALKGLTPSLMTAFIELCDGLDAAGHNIEIRLPNSGPITETAERSGLSALYDCRRVQKQTPCFNNSTIGPAK